MFKFNIISQNLNIDFLKFKFFALLFSLILIVITLKSKRFMTNEECDFLGLEFIFYIKSVIIISRLC